MHVGPSSEPDYYDNELGMQDVPSVGAVCGELASINTLLVCWVCAMYLFWGV